MNHKIYLSLTDNDIEVLKTLLSTSQSENLNLLLKLFIDKEDKDEYIRHKVYLSLSDLSGFEPDDFNDNSDLNLDLGLKQYHKKSLKNYFQRIVKDLKSVKIITVKECEALNDVNDCLKLVKSKI
ncbi:hypothetical protein [Haliscomenobacter hydrossis]|uniref:Uncharacterized protein n=1 Tax=Haliscomenobacter hydrossis (strain ATCC 27775 / DSM 1100 / LMG 10767 / O) TaxID=760192 RepID=F4L6B5_HALH1|nr:hypothetical protein [Haliscomenobacter hydrossis]AEE48797.1 hypothetical protein Halhy_0896 [Haliscomenobacter hydrossis DSM 1100]